MTGGVLSDPPGAALPSGQRLSAAPQIEAELAALADLRDRMDEAVPRPSERAMRNPRRTHSVDPTAALYGLEAAIRSKNAAHLEGIASNPPVASGVGPADWQKARLALFAIRDQKAHRELLETESRLRSAAAELDALAGRVRAAVP